MIKSRDLIKNLRKYYMLHQQFHSIFLIYHKCSNFPYLKLSKRRRRNNPSSPTWSTPTSCPSFPSSQTQIWCCDFIFELLTNNNNNRSISWNFVFFFFLWLLWCFWIKQCYLNIFVWQQIDNHIFIRKNMYWHKNQSNRKRK